MSRSSGRPLLGGRWFGRGWVRRPWLGRRGVAALEFAMVAPLMLTLMLAGTDVVLWMRTWMQMQRSVAGVSQVITQYKNFYTSDFTSVFLPIAQATLSSGALTCNTGSMAVTGIDNSTGTPKVSWQWKSGSCAASAYTTTAAPVMPGGYVPPSGLSVIVTEMTTTQAAYVFSASIMGGAGSSTVAVYTVAMPRTGGLPTLTSGTRPSS
ncbi:TadE/TadG family type IV pilus assembly protein [Acidisphaera sp. L21]|uniref:TadE/TadG family type IV pilus assembly protein n=1 Tax=Acidisphaera sp. L21 TaxID=1641851 RepID=UPI00131BF60F|nr:TadE/TadG family type IV pilus assembly protein [Acidisphaera sp. L21]